MSWCCTRQGFPPPWGSLAGCHRWWSRRTASTDYTSPGGLKWGTANQSNTTLPTTPRGTPPHTEYMFGRGGGQGAPKYLLCPMSGGTLHYEHCSTLPACAVLTELRDQDGVEAIADYAGLPSTTCPPHAPWSFELQTCPCMQQKKLWTASNCSRYSSTFCKQSSSTTLQWWCQTCVTHAFSDIQGINMSCEFKYIITRQEARQCGDQKSLYFMYAFSFS